MEASTAQSWKPIIDYEAQDLQRQVIFDAEHHIQYTPPQKIYSMTEFGFDQDLGISPVAASDPFQLFSQDAINKFRADIFQPEVMQNCKYSGDLGACMLRGYAAKYSPFIYDAWHDPKLLDIVSKIAGVELVPNMDFEIGHINISIKSAEQADAERDADRKQSSFAKDSAPVVGWHRDSYPFVVVTMLSDCTNMIGGETAIRTTDGKVIKIRGPTKGCAVVLQGRYITHQALKALGAQERITMVTSFRPKSAHTRDDSVLNTVRGTSDLSELYFGFGEYRLAALEERLSAQLNDLRSAHGRGRRTDVTALKKFLTDSISFLEATNTELVPEDQVVAGHQPTLDIPDAVVEESSSSLQHVKAML